MNLNHSFFTRPGLQVTATWLWFLLLPLSLVAILVGLLNLEMGQMMGWWQAHPYMQAYLEAITAGLLPLLFVWRNGETLNRYGIHHHRLASSIGLSLAAVAGFLVWSVATTGNWLNHSDMAAQISWPATLWHALFGIFANGPLEIFFYIFLLEKTDEAFSGGQRLLSAGFWITTILHSLMHVITTQNLANAAVVFVVFFALGLIYRYTKNALGPMLGWTLINGMVWAYISFAGWIS